jgi:hypothetical protein
VWGDSLTRGESDYERGDVEEQEKDISEEDGDEESGGSSKAIINLPPPIRRTSRQSM